MQSPMTTESSHHRSIEVAPGRSVKVTPVFDTYWHFAAKRQELFLRRVEGARPPWTDDAIIASHRFTNAYRASDRVSQYLIRNVIYGGSDAPEEVVFRTLLFKFFNRIETWRTLEAEVGFPTWKQFDFEKYARVLDRTMEGGERLYSAAYIMPSPNFGNARKHRNHLCLLEHMMRDKLPRRLAQAKHLSDVFETLRTYRSLGDFLAFQYAIDLNYSAVVNFSEMEFVVAGPGARDGLRKCFADSAGLSDADLIRLVAQMASDEFKRLKLPFRPLWGRPLQLIDCQNLFCEVDKYARVAHPEYSGSSGRTRIKQKFTPQSAPLPQWYPPKWNIKPPSVAAENTKATSRRRAIQLPLTLEAASRPSTTALSASRRRDDPVAV